MKVMIKSAEAETIEIDFSGGSFEVTQQKAVFESDDGEMRIPFVLNLPKGAKPYPVGDYKFSDACFQYDGKKQVFQLARELALVPLRAASVVQPARAL